MGAIGALIDLVLLLFLIALVARAVLDWTGVLTPGRDGSGWVDQARALSHQVTEPVIAPVRRVLNPVRLGDVQIDLAFPVVFVATMILRSIV
jgi:YggT family protein